MLEQNDWKVIDALSDGIPIAPEPYLILAEKAEMGEAEFLSRMEAMKNNGVLRRVGAIIKHRKAGFFANALCAWVVPAEKTDEIGGAVARESAVSHCYSRLPAPGWPYNLYVMVHAKDRASCESVIRRLEAENGLSEGKRFYSVREWKKSSMRYFGKA